MGDKARNKKRLWIGVGVGAFVLLVGGAYVGAYFVAGNQVPANASAAGVEIGGVSPDEAEETLRAELGSRTETPIVIASDDGTTFELVPAESGLDIDFAATVASAGGGFSWNPAHIFTALTGGDAVELVTTVDEEQLTAAVTEAAETFDSEPVDATIALTDGSVETTPAQAGTQLNVEETAAGVQEAFENGESEAAAVTASTDPSITDEEIEEFRASQLDPALDGPITLTSESGDIELSEEQVATVLRITGSDGDLGVGFDSEQLAEVTSETLDDLNIEGPKDATFKWENNQVVVVPGQAGLVVTPEAIEKGFEEALASENRSAALEASEEEPDFTTEEAKELRPREVIGEFTTNFPHAPYRNTNLSLAASKVTGYVLMPGETFSLDNTLGPRTEENGWVSGYIIDGGNLVRATAGGISQAATTLYNAGFFAGYEDVEHRPHSLYFDRYPAGRESTILSGSIDMRFKNDTEYPAIMQGFVERSSPGNPGSITFRIWSIPTYDKVESSELVRSNYYSGTTRTLDTPNCEPQAPIQGFTVNYQRLFYQGGSVVKTQDYEWTYSAGDRIICA